ncbi:hypothetical protein EYF80_057643 [Liparis tanakae]|uniref:Uncharacterized protein n=1 Tax=Liparis tanakae TaxID=230148 RepID=A0A4Z2ETL8_9TELE|nr:hypothetical protein EYF80_057643 [Liparis tanakae]
MDDLSGFMLLMEY